MKRFSLSSLFVLLFVSLLFTLFNFSVRAQESTNPNESESSDAQSKRISIQQQVPVSLTISIPASAAAQTMTVPFHLNLDLKLDLIDTITGSIRTSTQSGPAAITITDLSTQKVYLVRGTNLYDKPDGRPVEPNYVAGTALDLIAESNAWFMVKAQDGTEGWVITSNVSRQDPRIFFKAKERGITGYILGGTNRGNSNLSTIMIDDAFFGQVEIQIDKIQSIQVVENETAPFVVNTFEGNQYAGILPQGYDTAYLFFVTDEALIRLDGRKPLILELLNGKEGIEKVELAATLPVSTTQSSNLKTYPIYVGQALTDGYAMGVNTSKGLTNWVADKGDHMCMSYPGNQDWGAVFITLGEPTNDNRPGHDISAYKTLSLEMKGEAGGEEVLIGMKDNTDADDGKETKLRVSNLTKDWQVREFPLRAFATADLSQIYIVTEFVFDSDMPAETICFRNIQFVP